MYYGLYDPNLWAVMWVLALLFRLGISYWQVSLCINGTTKRKANVSKSARKSENMTTQGGDSVGDNDNGESTVQSTIADELGDSTLGDSTLGNSSTAVSNM